MQIQHKYKVTGDHPAAVSQTRDDHIKLYIGII